ncbi:hypothetical protein ATEIFO6365_0001071200 [Aspergillus terreus]|uniref:Uncharacterized protein n=1 Tax=Aspergillus terreus TaxID=33178 RepID=A0A5M3YQ90_ASPTE|nr:hypothetical protein ATETN484_0001063300 [Aspergillus terreus]GFF12489.1 hypothetical protein ATEIFO6365_0001071200 [Aspergillus terreus]
MLRLPSLVQLLAGTAEEAIIILPLQGPEKTLRVKIIALPRWPSALDAKMTTFALAGDTLYMILDILGDERDYNSLFQCALASKCFTEHSLAVLYKLYNISPVRSGGAEDEQLRFPRMTATRGDVATWKWALMWRSIVLSTLNQTYLPYYTYIRYLDYDDLTGLLDAPGFTGKIIEDFFTPELVEFLGPQYETKGSKRLRSSKMLKGNSQVPIKLCSVQPSVLSEWLEHLPLLQTMTIWSGYALTHQAGERIHNHCPEFKQLTIYGWNNGQSRSAEDDSETFLRALRPDSLEYFEILSFSQLGPRSIRALETQSASLSELKLTSLTIETIAELGSLPGLPELKVLVLTDSSPVARTEEFYSVVTKVADWIRSCRALTRLELRRFVDDPALLAQVLTDDKVRLSILYLEGYTMAGSHTFHEALACQDALETLYLRGEPSESPTDNELLVQAIQQLNKLRQLELKDISGWFTTDHVITLTPYLPHLERLWISGEHFSDDVWDAFLCLPKLQSLSIQAFSDFSAQGILDFISQLGPGNKGFSLSILNALSDKNLAEEAQTVIRETLKVSLDGSFDFGLWREEDYSENSYDRDQDD